MLPSQTYARTPKKTNALPTYAQAAPESRDKLERIASEFAFSLFVQSLFRSPFSQFCFPLHLPISFFLKYSQSPPPEYMVIGGPSAYHESPFNYAVAANASGGKSARFSSKTCRARSKFQFAVPVRQSREYSAFIPVRFITSCTIHNCCASVNTGGSAATGAVGAAGAASTTGA